MLGGTRLQSNSGALVLGSEGRFNCNLNFGATYSPNDAIVPVRFTPPGGLLPPGGPVVLLPAALTLLLMDVPRLRRWRRRLLGRLRRSRAGLRRRWV
jgi:hypothetical protein